MRASACVDCGTTTIGEIQRCGSCQDHHFSRREDSLGQRLLAWLVGAEILLAISCGVVLAMRCA